MTKTEIRFDKCLSLQIDATHAELETVKLWPVSVRKVKRLAALKRRLRKLESRISGR